MDNKNWIWVLLMLLACLGPCLPGQSPTGQITGEIKNMAGDCLPGITVMVTNAATNAEVTVITGKKGKYRFLALDPGLYQISIEQDGYMPCVIGGVRLMGGQALRLPIKLQKKD